MAMTVVVCLVLVPSTSLSDCYYDGHLREGHQQELARCRELAADHQWGVIYGLSNSTVFHDLE